MLISLVSLALAADPTGLELNELTRAVIAANPEATVASATLAQARAQAAAAAPWPDPMVDLTVAPLSLGGMPGWQVEVRQDLPLWGARRAARDMAGADADAASSRLDMMRLELAEMAAMAWADWYSIHRELDLTAATLGVLRETRATTLSRVSVGRASDLDVLQVDAELGWLTTRTHASATERDVVAVRINTLLHRAVDVAVDAPPARVNAPTPEAGGERPEIAEAAAMTRAAEAEERMARADRLPMLGVMTGWDAMQAMPEDRWMAGVSVQVPLDQKAKAATVDAAAAGVSAARADVARAQDEVAGQVATAERRLRGDSAVLAALEHDVLPAARARVAAARAGFAAGTVDLRQLLEAERAALEADYRHEQQLATVVLRARELELAHGLLLPGAKP
ncbi:TolC family protein [Myxococcota bacterium]|nr:TolC family protein [Myxococcota bacterium]